jgi:AcrR family transcriptional regulator
VSRGRRKPSASALLPGRSDTTRHQRLLSASVLTIAEHGYEHATVAHVIAVAGISRATFYEHFASKEACFLAALEDVERSILAAVIAGIEAQSEQSALAAAIASLVSFAQEHPAPARLLMNATMAAGPGALDARDHGVGAIARLIDSAEQWADPVTRAPVLPTEILIGTAYRLLGSRLRRGEHRQEAVQEDLLDWVADYEDPTGRARWRAPATPPAAERAALLARAPLRTPAPLAPGRPRGSSSSVAENHRQRIIFATAEVIRRDGYPAASVAEITRAAQVDSRVFYSLFAGKHDAFRALREFAFQHAMAVTAGAFFAVEQWPRRIWEAARAFTHFLEQNRTLADACLIESDAGGPETVQRFEDLVAGCTIFLQEGYQYQPHSNGSPPSRVALDAIAQAELEIIYRRIRGSSGLDVAELAGQLAYVCLAPFVGAARAIELIDEIAGS